MEKYFFSEKLLNITYSLIEIRKIRYNFKKRPFQYMFTIFIVFHKKFNYFKKKFL